MRTRREEVPGEGRARDGVNDPFAVLGLDQAAGLTDDEVRAAWRRIAEATHPDRADGGDPERFARAAAAYTDLRTPSGRGEARAALADRGSGRPGARSLPRRPSRAGPKMSWWLSGGRPARLAPRIVIAGGACAAALLAAGPGPAGPALVAGAVTWLLLTARRELGRR